ncbi:anthranilate phosphoribosyltransferase [Vampirovibrio sp.]|uniref:anthranilate phosphoribosyltransferase n=1 Tax=Vampirovibrio sp. TaxID=2717857 RepID=UPI003593C749
MLNRQELRQLIHLEYSEADTLHWLGQLTPEAITPALFSDALACLEETVLPVALPAMPVMDCCGTGGSGLPHFNTSTTVAFILAAAGVPVVKFGNRGLSSLSGSFDLLAQLGFSAPLDLRRIPEGLAHCGLVFLFAPQCYPQLAPFNQLRRQLKTRTLFNFLGPLLNPVKPAYRLLGVSHPLMQTQMAHYLASTGVCQRGWIACGESGLDELEIAAPTRVFEIQKTHYQEMTIPPFVIETETENNPALHPIGPHNPVENEAILMRLFQNQDQQSPYYQMVCFNAGAGLLIAGKASSLAAGVQEAKALLRGGKALEKLNECRRFYESFSTR